MTDEKCRQCGEVHPTAIVGADRLSVRLDGPEMWPMEVVAASPLKFAELMASQLQEAWCLRRQAGRVQGENIALRTENTRLSRIEDKLGTRWTAKPLSGLPQIVCLCGSTRFKDQFVSAALEQTLAGRIVLTIGCDMRTDDEIFGRLEPAERANVKRKLDELHKRKIDLADLVYVLNVGGYIGDSTRSEINYAVKHAKPVAFLEPPDPAGRGLAAAGRPATPNVES